MSLQAAAALLTLRYIDGDECSENPPYQDQNETLVGCNSPSNLNHSDSRYGSIKDHHPQKNTGATISITEILRRLNQRQSSSDESTAYLGHGTIDISAYFSARPLPVSPTSFAPAHMASNPVETLPQFGLSFQSIHVIENLPLHFFLHRPSTTFYVLFNGMMMSPGQHSFVSEYAAENEAGYFLVPWTFHLPRVFKIPIPKAKRNSEDHFR